jgi:hypothetical protein
MYLRAGVALKICLLAGTLVLLVTGVTAQTQVGARAANGSPVLPTSAAATSPAGSSQSESPETVPRVPGVGNLFRGVNAGVNYAAVHHSTIGWYTVMTPALSYAFSQHYSADVSSSIYFKRKYLTYIGGFPPTQGWIEDAANGGDTLFGFHGSFAPGPIEEVATFTLSAPTGDPAAGLGTGHVTYDVTNHIERHWKQLGSFVDVGAGNSSILFNNLVQRNYSTLGGLGHFLVGAEGWIGRRLFVESLMYEQLPFGSQKLFTGPIEGSRLPLPLPTITSSAGANEDNGLTTYIGIPVAGNLTFSGYYNRSLRRHTDTVSFGWTWVLRGRRSDSMVDRALEEAEKPATKN